MIKNNPIPWEDRPQGLHDVMWRYSGNPIVGRYDIPSSNSIIGLAFGYLKEIVDFTKNNSLQ